ncbi:ComF family protein [Microbacterium esteraromaticum]|uniref:ComF family protein n=1 Tax=Microbacterium esteraromaticum TaxID=57043 RepID=A0A7D7WBW2_9MICO|nr:phosphoribosyltransferase family protein [Microbacterium esteraromaticum]QMU97755.1 ComF family protein [Microbacterium esteraromaticum]
MDADHWRRIASDALALLLAASCPGCDRGGTLLCDRCRMQLRADPHEVRTPHGLAVHAALRYEGVPARAIRRLKEDGATLLARPLGAALGAVLRPRAGDALIVPVPTSRASFRRRGYRVPDLLVRRAGLEAHRNLASARLTDDQRGLGRAGRARNVAGSMRATAHGRGGVVIVDDVVTTGATLDEAARALSAAGFTPVCAVALASTPRIRDTVNSSLTDSDMAVRGD